MMRIVSQAIPSGNHLGSYMDIACHSCSNWIWRSEQQRG
jgi:hypothetical protein